MNVRFPTGVTDDPRRLPELRRALIDFADEGGVWEKSELIRSMNELVSPGGSKTNTLGETVPAVDTGQFELGIARGHNMMDWYRRTLPAAQLIYVSAELCDILYASYDSIPDDTVLDQSMLPAPSGLVVLERPFIGTDSTGDWEDVRVDALLWGEVNLPPRDTWYAADPVELGQSFAAFRWFDPAHQDDEAATNVKDRADRDGIDQLDTMWLPLGRSDWVLGDRVDRTAHDGVIEGSPQAASMIEDRKLMAALWALIQQKKVVDRTEVPASRPVKRRLARAGHTAPDVTVVHLRRSEYSPRHSDGGTDRRIGVRFIVRPHWRNQAYGPDRSLRKLILVPPHMKGPEDAPLQHTERVWSVDR